MKKFILSSAVVMAAVFGALATTHMEDSKLVDPDVTNLAASPCSIQGKCTNMGESDCVSNSVTYRLIDSSPTLTCSVPAKGTFHE